MASSSLSNAGEFYLEQYLAAKDAFDKKDEDKCDTLCRELLADPFLPIYYRAACNMFAAFTADVPEDKLKESLRVLGEIEEMVEAGAIESHPKIEGLKKAAEDMLKTVMEAGSDSDDEGDVTGTEGEVAGSSGDAGKGKAKGGNHAKKMAQKAKGKREDDTSKEKAAEQDKEKPA